MDTTIISRRVDNHQCHANVTHNLKEGALEAQCLFLPPLFCYSCKLYTEMRAVEEQDCRLHTRRKAPGLFSGLSAAQSQDVLNVYQPQTLAPIRMLKEAKRSKRVTVPILLHRITSSPPTLTPHTHTHNRTSTPSMLCPSADSSPLPVSGTKKQTQG